MLTLALETGILDLLNGGLIFEVPWNINLLRTKILQPRTCRVARALTRVY